MRKQKKQINGSAKKITMAVFMAIGLSFWANAQKDLETEKLKRINISDDYNYVDYTIPTDKHKALYLEVKGADGGHIPGKAGGSGAMIKGWMKLGNKGGEIP